MPPPTWLVVGLLLSFMEALWMGMVLDRNGRCNNQMETFSNSSLSSRTATGTPSSWKSQTFPCRSSKIISSSSSSDEHQQQQVIFVGLDHVETYIVGTIAMNLNKTCWDHNSHNYVAVTFTQQPVGSILWTHQEETTTTTNPLPPPKLVAFLKQPTDRVHSEFFRLISIHQLEPTNKRFQSFLFDEQPNLEHYYLRHLSVHSSNQSYSHQSPVDVNETKSYNARVRIRTEILDRFDFIGTTERMLESLVVLKMLWGLSWKDILYIPAYPAFFLNKVTGENATTSCVYQVPFFTNTERESLLQSKRWKRRISGDVALYDAVNVRLDATIDMLGFDEVQIQVQEYRRLLEEAIERCWTLTTFPCSANGDLALYNHSCGVDELRCGHQCLDELFAVR